MVYLVTKGLSCTLNNEVKIYTFEFIFSLSLHFLERNKANGGVDTSPNYYVSPSVKASEADNSNYDSHDCMHNPNPDEGCRYRLRRKKMIYI